MVFNSDLLLLGLPPVVVTLFWLARTKKQRYILLTISSYIFYGYWNWRFCFLLLFSSLVSFTVALLIDQAKTAASRRAWMLGAIAVDLSILGFFKYYNFFAATVHSLVPALSPPVLNIVLPIGI